MKRIGFLWDLMISYENFLEAIKNASKGKTYRRCVQRVLDNPRAYYERLLTCLDNHDIGHYTPKTVIDASSMKKRDILVPAFFPDQIIHHMLIQVIEKVLLKGQYEKSCASIKGRGQLYASTQLRKFLRHNKHKRLYWVKLDVRHFYPSIDHDILKKLLAKRLKDTKILSLCSLIIDSCDNGIPIGNYTSQIFSNFYLQEFDHFVKEKLSAPFYVRYMDDMVLVSPNKRKLKRIVNEMKRVLHDYTLETHDDEIIYPLNERHPIDFVGYRHYQEHITIRRRVFKHARRMAVRIYNKVKDVLCERQRRRIASYLGYVAHSDSRFIENTYYLLNKEALKHYAEQILLRI